MTVMLESQIAGLPAPRRGKVRDVYDLGDQLLIVTTDRISAFDCIFPNGIPHKGRVLNTLALHWFSQTRHIVENHVVSDDPSGVLPAGTPLDDYRWRCMVARKCKPIEVECVVRGYLDGSAWVEYEQNGTLACEPAALGLRRKHRFEAPLFTPATKAASGHDINISFGRVVELLGKDTATFLRDTAIALYKFAHDAMLAKGFVLADTKFEFGGLGDKIILIDEALTPDSSRFFERESYVEGRKSVSVDKQFVRDYCETLDWDKNPPAPRLPDDIVAKTSEKYLKILEVITGRPAPWLSA